MAIEKHNLIFGGVSANDYGIYIEDAETVYNAPTRAVETVNIPGRNGALTIDKGHYDNITIEYSCFTYADTQIEFRRKLNAFKNAILSQLGYQKLIDDYQPDEYRMAIYMDGLEIVPDTFSMIGDFTLKFNCKPQRYLRSGDEKITVTDGVSVTNPTLYDSEPLLMVEGYGNIGFNGYSITLTNETVGKVYPFTATSINKRGYTSMFFDVELDYPFADGDEIEFQTILKGDFGQVFASASSTARTGPSSFTIFIPDSMYDYYLTRDGTFEAYIDSCMFTYGVSDTAHTYIDTTLTDEDENTGVCYWHVLYDYDGANNIRVTFSCASTNGDSFRAYSKTIEMQPYICVSNSTLLGHPTYIDCEIGEAYMYKDGVLYGLNSYIDLGSDLPKLSNGINTFEVDDTITSLIVVPRWWQL